MPFVSRLTITTFVAAFLLFPTTSSAQSSKPVTIIPTPRVAKQLPGTVKLGSQTALVLSEGTTDEDRFAADLWNEYLLEMGRPPLRIVYEGKLRKRPSEFLLIGTPRSRWAREVLAERSCSLTTAMKDEGYVLDVATGGILIMAESVRGRFYGVQTLLQLASVQKTSVVIPRVSIHDWPLLAFRGISDDLSRGQVSTMENFRKIIRFLARHKLNVYSPYIEDIFVFRNHPLIGKNRGALTAAEVRELDAYARKYHVELIPIFETLGHWENILAMPEYVQYAEFPGAHTLNVSDERIYDLLDEMIGELSDAFSSPYFNMAADESWDVGLGASRDRVTASDLATVHAEHYKKVLEILERHGKKPLMYGDIILNEPKILGKIPKDVIIVDWQYWAGERYPSPAIFRSAGFPFVVSPALWNFMGPFPNYLHAIVNIKNLTRDGFHNGALGVLTSNWNDYGGEALRELNYYGFAWAAECAWKPLEAEATVFEDKFFRQFFGSEEAGRTGRMAYAILSQPFNQMTWHELWRHPLLPLTPTGMNPLLRIQSIESSMPIVRQLIEETSAHASTNKDHLRLLRFIADLNLWFAAKLKTAGMIAQWQRDSTLLARPDSLRLLMTPFVNHVIDQLKGLRREFKTLWLSTNRPENLELLMQRYDRQVAYWEEILREPGRSDPTIRSQWMYHPSANPRSRNSSLSQVPRAYFRISFEKQNAPSGIQVIADTHAKIFVNGVRLGELSARPSLSLSVEHQRIKRWDLTRYLRSDQNVIAVEAATYDAFGSAGINILGYRVDASGTYHDVVLDSLMRVTDRPSQGWMDPAFDDSAWLSAVAKPSPNPVIAPDFWSNRPSWIER